MRTAVVGASHVMLFPRGLEKAGLDASLQVDSLVAIGSLDVDLYDTLQAKADGAGTTIEGCFPDPSAMTPSEKRGVLAMATFVGTRLPRRMEMIKARAKLRKMSRPEAAQWLRVKAWGYMVDKGIEITEEEFKQIWEKEERKFLGG
ncbi:hypothetical protein [Sulfobacillus harzensis]|uniref:Uncharacterized protein n=1 Tax=Sulfobacillus harzensis TaxID=2729629 RepID=A0A7Y0L7A0_9FIRM|nr:hypothetical protein [Sulfobacillus harzensis]NMP24629.1 hypothetical protein [Sulfobacillus harzensis]